MKYYLFYRENNDFTDILNDSSVKSNQKVILSWRSHLLLGFTPTVKDSDLNIILLRYSDDIRKLSDYDRTPVPYVDYIPKKTLYLRITT